MDTTSCSLLSLLHLLAEVGESVFPTCSFFCLKQGHVPYFMFTALYKEYTDAN
jgi:hypothetical protein